MKKGWNKIVVVFAAFFAVFLCNTLLAGQGCAEESSTAGWVEARNPTNYPEQGDAGKPTKEAVIQKTQTLQMPFIANNGRVDEHVSFYAKTFGGTVFVTKEGEIVYSLPSGRDVPAGASLEPGRSRKPVAGAQGGKGAEGQGWRGQALLVPAEAELVMANGYAPFLRVGNAHCPPKRVLANALLAAYLPGLQKETTHRVVSTSTPRASNVPHDSMRNKPQYPPNSALSTPNSQR